MQPGITEQQDALGSRLHGLPIQLLLLEPYLPKWNTLANKE